MILWLQATPLMALPMCDHHPPAFCQPFLPWEQFFFLVSSLPVDCLGFPAMLHIRLSHLCRVLSWVLGSPTNHCRLRDGALKT